MFDVARITGDLPGFGLFYSLRSFFHKNPQSIEFVVSLARQGRRPLQLRVVVYPPDPAESSRP